MNFWKTKPVEEIDDKRDEKIAELKVNLRKAKSDAKRQAERYEEKHLELCGTLDKLRAELKVLKDLNQDNTQVMKRSVELERREAIVKAKEDSVASMAKEIAKANEKSEEARKEGEKKGYADGVADGLREVHKITADDRKMMAQIAALAASSHVGDANKEIAEAVAKEIHGLPAGKQQATNTTT